MNFLLYILADFYRGKNSNTFYIQLVGFCPVTMPTTLYVDEMQFGNTHAQSMWIRKQTEDFSFKLQILTLYFDEYYWFEL